MIIRNPNARIAGAIYLMLAFFAAATLWMLLFIPPRTTVETLISIPGGERLLVTISFLFLSSIAMGAYLLVRFRAPKIALFMSGVIVCVGFAWNIVAPVLWLVPLFFVLQAGRTTRDN